MVLSAAHAAAQPAATRAPDQAPAVRATLVAAVGEAEHRQGDGAEADRLEQRGGKRVHPGMVHQQRCRKTRSPRSTIIWFRIFPMSGCRITTTSTARRSSAATS